MNKTLLFALCWLTCVSVHAQSGDGAASPEPTVAPANEPAGRTLSLAEAVSLARSQNPTLKAALLELESAQWDVFGSEAQYEPVLQVDGTGSQVATANASGRSIRVNTVRRGELGTELRKHFLWGTDLSLRVSTSVQKSEFSGGIARVAPPTMGTTGGTIDPSIFSAFFGIGDFGPLYGLSARFTLKQPLWRGRGREVNEASMREARLSRTSAEHTRDRVGSELLRDVLTAYWELWYADAALGIQKQSRAVAIRQRDEAAARAQSGSLAPAEVLTFDTQAATREEDVLSAHNERARREHELARLLGQNETLESYAVLSEPMLDGESFGREQVEHDALNNSAALRERIAALQLAQLRARTAEDPNKPRVDLDGYVQSQGLGNRDYGDAADMFVSGDVISALATITYEAPVRSRVRQATAARARIAIDVAEEQLREARQRTLSEVRAALDREVAGRERIRLTEQTADIATRQLSAEQARYRTGSSTSLAVLEAEERVRSASLRLARARADYAESVLVIEHLSGALLARHAQ
jgi:outer membrane protein